ncbi:MAG: hypothetical protein HY236_02965 [Acidobacteria bacterium]|nr:hypothetical protein [Acidobacteriota bacterium]
MATTAAESILGRAPEDLSLEERHALAGSFVALQIYTPAELPLRRIEAIGDTVQDCITMLRRRGLDPSKFEFTPLKPPY